MQKLSSWLGSRLFLSYENLILDSVPASGHRATEDDDDGDDDDGDDDDVNDDDDAGVEPLRLRLLQLKIRNFHWNNWKFTILGCAQLPVGCVSSA